MAQANIKAGDVIFLDYAITDGYYLPHNKYYEGGCFYPTADEENIALELLSIIEHIYRAGAFCALILNPSKPGIAGYLDLENVHKNICRDYSIPIIHVGDLFREAVARGVSVEALMRDDAHSSPEAMAVLGRVFVSLAKDLRSLGHVAALDGRDIYNPRVIPLAPMVDPDRRIAFSSRLRNSEMASLTIGDKLEFEIADHELLLGLVVNMGGSGARVRISSSEGEEVRDLIYNWENDNPKSYMSIFVPMRVPLSGGQDGVVLEVLPQDGSWTPPELFKPSVLEGSYDSIAIEGLLVAELDKSTKLDNAKPGYRDLLEGQYAALCEELRTATTVSHRDMPGA